MKENSSCNPNELNRISKRNSHCKPKIYYHQLDLCVESSFTYPNYEGVRFESNSIQVFVSKLEIRNFK